MKKIITRDLVRKAKKLDREIKLLTAELDSTKKQLKKEAEDAGVMGQYWEGSHLGYSIVESDRQSISLSKLQKANPLLYRVLVQGGWVSTTHTLSVHFK